MYTSVDTCPGCLLAHAQATSPRHATPLLLLLLLLLFQLKTHCSFTYLPSFSSSSFVPRLFFLVLTCSSQLLSSSPSQNYFDLMRRIARRFLWPTNVCGRVFFARPERRLSERASWSKVSVPPTRRIQCPTCSQTCQDLLEAGIGKNFELNLVGRHVCSDWS